MAASVLVHCLGPGAGGTGFAEETAKAAAAQAGAHGPYTEKLPPNVEEMRDAILAAAHAGRIEELAVAIEWNELAPDFGAARGTDPIAHLKSASADGRGLEVLAVLADILALPPARLATGKDPENNAVYVWPYLAELALDRLTPAQEVDLYRLMPPEKAKPMRDGKTWTWWRLSIGADGTWHAFRRP